MSAPQEDLQLSHRPVHPVRHLAFILVCLLAAMVIDLTSLPELVAILAYEVMLLAAVGSAIHWRYLRKH